MDFTTLLYFLTEANLARIGCFKYEDVDGVPANALPGQVSEEVKAERCYWLKEHQQAISKSLLAARVCRTIEIMADTVYDEGAVARSHWDAAEINGNGFHEGKIGLTLGDQLMVTVEEANEYDLWCRPVGSKSGLLK